MSMFSLSTLVANQSQFPTRIFSNPHKYWLYLSKLFIVGKFIFVHCFPSHNTIHQQYHIMRVLSTIYPQTTCGFPLALNRMASSRYPACIPQFSDPFRILLAKSAELLVPLPRNTVLFKIDLSLIHYTPSSFSFGNNKKTP